MGLGEVAVMGGWHEHVMIGWVTGENVVGSRRWGQGSAELQAKKRLGLCFSRS